DLFYKPREYSQFFLELERRFDERTTGVAGDESESTELLRGQLEWDYDYSDRLSHTATVFIQNKDRQCDGIGETLVGGGFDLDWQLRRWIKIGAGVETRARTIDSCSFDDIDVEALEYDAQQFNIHAVFTL
ncbi:MAG: hypothetical protein AB8B87_22885, partial [Granulosicoccus sp.]